MGFYAKFRFRPLLALLGRKSFQRPSLGLLRPRLHLTHLRAVLVQFTESLVARAICTRPRLRLWCCYKEAKLRKGANI